MLDLPPLNAAPILSNPSTACPRDERALCTSYKDETLLDADDIILYSDADDNISISASSASKSSVTTRSSDVCPDPGHPVRKIARSRRPQRTLRSSTKARDPYNMGVTTIGESSHQYLVQLAEDIRERYRRRSSCSMSVVEHEIDAHQITLLPTIYDAPLWLVPVREGEEDAIVHRLMANAMASRRPRILSAFARPSLPGRIYIEAQSNLDVCESCRNLSDIFPHGITFIPIEEAVSLLTLTVSFFIPQVGSWLRVASGLYRGDLAYVVAVEDMFAQVALIPRLRLDGTNKRRWRRSDERPPKRLFDLYETVKVYGEDSVVRCGQCWKFQGEVFRNGLLEKEFRFRSFIQELATPTVAELLHFYDNGNVRPNDISWAIAQISKASLRRGDRVEVTGGQLLGLIGEVRDLDDHAVRILPVGAMNTPDSIIDIPAVDVIKCFQPGDFVRVRTGNDVGRKGWVASYDGSLVTFHERRSMEEVKVYARDVDLCEEHSHLVSSIRTPALQWVRKDPLVGRHIIVTRGPYKDYRGIIKYANHIRNIAVVELEATLRKSLYSFRDLGILCQDGVSLGLAWCPISVVPGWHSRLFIPPSALPLTPSTPIPTSMFSGQCSPAWDPSSRTPTRPDEVVDPIPELWLGDRKLYPLKIMVTFTQAWVDRTVHGTFQGCLGFTLPVLESNDDGQRTHVDVQMRNRWLTVHRDIPIQFLVPVHPAGPGELVAVISGDVTGDIVRIDKIDQDGMCLLTTPHPPHTLLTATVKQRLAVLHRS